MRLPNIELYINDKLEFKHEKKSSTCRESSGDKSKLLTKIFCIVLQNMNTFHRFHMSSRYLTTNSIKDNISVSYFA